jgi:hypothetical protein
VGRRAAPIWRITDAEHDAVLALLGVEGDR